MQGTKKNEVFGKNPVVIARFFNISHSCYPNPSC